MTIPEIAKELRQLATLTARPWRPWSSKWADYEEVCADWLRAVYDIGVEHGKEMEAALGRLEQPPKES